MKNIIGLLHFIDKQIIIKVYIIITDCGKCLKNLEDLEPKS